MMRGEERAVTRVVTDRAGVVLNLEDVRGCNRLSCEQCGSPVLFFDAVLLQGSLSREALRKAYDVRFRGSLVASERSAEYRLYACRCRVKMVKSVRVLAEERYDSDLDWSCRGHHARPVSPS